VLVSTDKAAQPASVMGATKRLAELVALDAAPARSASPPSASANILGSSGSVLELMLEHLRDGTPIELTDREATPLLHDAREAVSLIVKADLAGPHRRDLLARHGRARFASSIWPNGCLPGASRSASRVCRSGISASGPGEKLREELTTQGLELVKTKHRRIWMARQPQPDQATTRRVLRALRSDLKEAMR
jgi:FlaA1/EpsC-like NDP-sugar epimerase